MTLSPYGLASAAQMRMVRRLCAKLGRAVPDRLSAGEAHDLIDRLKHEAEEVPWSLRAPAPSPVRRRVALTLVRFYLTKLEASPAIDLDAMSEGKLEAYWRELNGLYENQQRRSSPMILSASEARKVQEGPGGGRDRYSKSRDLKGLGERSEQSPARRGRSDFLVW